MEGFRMPFQPDLELQLDIDGQTYAFGEHPASPGIPCVREGSTAVVYKLDTPIGSKALKVFEPRYRTSSLVRQAGKIQAFSHIPGLRCCQRYHRFLGGL